MPISGLSKHSECALASISTCATKVPLKLRGTAKDYDTCGRHVARRYRIDTSVPEAVMIDTNARFRCFLEKATGYTAKQRAKKAQEAVKRAKEG